MLIPLSFQIYLSRFLFLDLSFQTFLFQPIFLKLSFQTSLSRPIFASVSFQACHSNLPVEAYLFKITFLYLSLEFRNLSFQSYLSRSDVLQGASRAPGRWAGGSGRPEALHCQGAVWSPPAQSSQGRRRRTLPWAAPKIFPPGRTWKSHPNTPTWLPGLRCLVVEGASSARRAGGGGPQRLPKAPYV